MQDLIFQNDQKSLEMIANLSITYFIIGTSTKDNQLHESMY